MILRKRIDVHFQPRLRFILETIANDLFLVDFIHVKKTSMFFKQNRHVEGKTEEKMLPISDFINFTKCSQGTGHTIFPIAGYYQVTRGDLDSWILNWFSSLLLLLLRPEGMCFSPSPF